MTTHADALLATDGPRLQETLSELSKHMTTLKSAVEALTAQLDTKTRTNGGAPVLAAKNLILGQYLSAISLFVQGRVSGTLETRGISPCVADAIDARVLYDKAVLLEKRLSRQLSAMLQLAVSEATAEVAVNKPTPAPASEAAIDDLFSDSVDNDYKTRDKEYKQHSRADDLPGPGFRRAADGITAPGMPTQQQLRDAAIATRRLVKQGVVQDLLNHYEGRPTEERAGHSRTTISKELDEYELENYKRVSSGKRKELEKKARLIEDGEERLLDSTLANDIIKMGKHIDYARPTIVDTQNKLEKLVETTSKKADRDYKRRRKG